MKKTPFLIILFIVLCSCSRKEREKTAPDSMMENAPSADHKSQAQPVPVIYSVPVKVARNIKKARYRIEVENMDKSTEFIENAVSTAGGIISTANLVSDTRTIENKILIRVPSQHFEKLMKEIGRQALYTNFRNISSEDVAGEFVDIDARLRTKREVEKKYTEMLRKDARTMDQVFSAEDEIRKLHEEMEVQTARLEFLKDQVAYSTIELELYQKVIFKEAPDAFVKADSYRFAEAFLAGWKVLVAILLVIVYIWPVWLVLAGGWLLRKYWYPVLFAKKKVVSEAVKRE